MLSASYISPMGSKSYLSTRPDLIQVQQKYPNLP